MYKNQKTFSPLECSLCKRFDCKYRLHYNRLYAIGFKIKVADCVRLQEQKRQDAMSKGR